MKRKLAYLVLSIVLVLSAFALFACGDDEIDIEDLEYVDDNTRAAVTLNFFIITDERTTDEARLSMQDAFNVVSEAEYRTHVEFVFCTAAEYQEMMEERFAAIESGEVLAPGEIDTTQGAVEHYIDELGQTKVRYPELEDGQIDIVLVTGKDMLTSYVESGRLMNLTEMLNGDFKNVRSYINADLYNSVALDDTWYSVPNNKVLGSYTYLFVRKDIAADSYFNEEDFSIDYSAYGRTTWNFGNIQKLLDATVKKNNLKLTNPDDPAVKDYTPLLPLYSTFDFPTTEFWTIDGSNSVYATFYDANTQYGDYITVTNPLAAVPTDDNYAVSQAYISYLKLMLANKTSGYDQAPEGATDFAVAVMEGDYGLRNKYAEDYMVMVMDTPRLEEDDMFSSMLAISNYTRSSERALEIIAALTTNQELRNILQYGEEGTHYTTYEENGITMVKRISNDYLMSLDHTGNAFMAYPCVTDGHTASIWNEGMLQNGEALRLPTYGFTAEDMWDKLYTAMIDSHLMLLLKPVADPNMTIGLDVASLEKYISNLKSIVLGETFPDAKAKIDKGEAIDEAELAVMEEIAANIANARVEELRAQATLIADNCIDSAKSLSEEYTARMEACTSVAELEEVMEEIRAEMEMLPLFSNVNDVRGTPLSLFKEIHNLKNPKFTMAGALRDWLVSVLLQ